MSKSIVQSRSSNKQWIYWSTFGNCGFILSLYCGPSLFLSYRAFKSITFCRNSAENSIWPSWWKELETHEHFHFLNKHRNICTGTHTSPHPLAKNHNIWNSQHQAPRRKRDKPFREFVTIAPNAMFYNFKFIYMTHGIRSQWYYFSFGKCVCTNLNQAKYVALVNQISDE